MIDELPLSDELNRKAIEALIRIADEQSRSLMSEREARLAIRAVFESVQGLVGEEVGEAINVAMSQFNGGTKRPLFPMHLKLSGGTVLFVSVCPRPTKSRSSTHQRANGARRSSAKVARTH